MEVRPRMQNYLDEEDRIVYYNPEEEYPEVEATYCTLCGQEIEIDGSKFYGDICCDCLEDMYSDELAVKWIEETGIIDEYINYFDMRTDRDYFFWKNVKSIVATGKQEMFGGENPTKRYDDNMLKEFCYDSLQDWYQYLTDYRTYEVPEISIAPSIKGLSEEYDPFANILKIMKGASR